MTRPNIFIKCKIKTSVNKEDYEKMDEPIHKIYKDTQKQVWIYGSFFDEKMDIFSCEYIY